MIKLKILFFFLLQLCLPSGLRFRTQKHSVEPTFHSFVLTKEDGHRTYGFSLLFYEECRNRKICAAMQTLQAMFITELSSGQNGTPPQSVFLFILLLQFFFLRTLLAGTLALFSFLFSLSF